MTENLKLNWDKDPNRLLPTIVQDAETGRVLMLGYMSSESLARTRATGKVTFFSRSRQQLWEKGETSGHALRLVSIAADCDGDAMLVRAIPRGPTCHTGQVSCFGAEEGVFEMLGELTKVIRDRAQTAPPDSYTTRLLTSGLKLQGAKVQEEAEEVVHAANSETLDRVAEEVADLLYHLLVLLRSQKLDLSSVHRVLRNRRRP